MLRSLIAAAMALAVMNSAASAGQTVDKAKSSRPPSCANSPDWFCGVRSIDIKMKRQKAPKRSTRAKVAMLSPSPIITGGAFSGIASFYGNESGSKTASGQRFNENALTAAHRSLPFGTKLRVTHKGQSVVVTINDRGPFIKGRVLDLSTAAARVIGLTTVGVGHVTAEVI